MGAGGADADAAPTQSVAIDKGMGKFDLILPVMVKGYPFISFNTSSGDTSFGQIYFGTAGNVLEASTDAAPSSDDSNSQGVRASADSSNRSSNLDVYAEQDSVSFVPNTSSTTQPSSLTPPSSFPDVVKFKNGEDSFLPGDEILIHEIRGTAPTFRPGNWYQIKGIYALSSHPQAILSTFVSATGPNSGNTNVIPPQTQVVAAGTGEFTLILPMLYVGYPHVSFYPAGGGPSFGSAYFGIGNSILSTIPDDLPNTLNISLDNSNVTPGPVSNPLQNPQQLNPQMPSPTFPNSSGSSK
jgi:hypothetical protein